MRRTYLYFALTLALAVAAAARAAETYTGVITDTMCGAKAHTMMKGHTDPECVRMCVKGPYVYALQDGTVVRKLSDQKTSAKFAAQKVKVAGTYDAKSNTIKVDSIEAVNSDQ
ncbi:MAG TPA: hypothetical protein VG096_05880 [Bryobacteraceae bacterium]|jgi:hypothetical protein|nr:hypothetical protein [Bryobacteraceae bacterium]